MNRRATALAALVLASTAACSPLDEKPDPDAAAEFDALPIHWLGETFEGHDLERIDGLDGIGPGVNLGYGTCTPSGALEASCTEPNTIQITPLCNHLDAVARNRVWRTRSIRGAPVGTIDGAPVLFTTRTQIKIYRGERTDPGTALRALAVLRSLNDIPPIVTARSRIPAPAKERARGRAPVHGLTVCGAAS